MNGSERLPACSVDLCVLVREWYAFLYGRKITEDCLQGGVYREQSERAERLFKWSRYRRFIRSGRGRRLRMSHANDLCVLKRISNQV